MFKLKEDGSVERTLTKKEVLELIRDYANFCQADFLKTDYDKLVYYLQEFYTDFYIPLGKKKMNMGFGIVEETDEVMYVDDEVSFSYGVCFIIQDGMFRGSTAWGDVVMDRVINNSDMEKELVFLIQT